jgi:uncharacterized membrane-anchored protein
MRQENDAGALGQPRRASDVGAILASQKRLSDLRDLAEAMLMFHQTRSDGVGPDSGLSPAIRNQTVPMQQIHLPTLGARYWAALCLASIFGANMGDFFAHNLGLGHVSGLPYLAFALAIVLVSERFDRSVHQVYYWTAIIIVRTAATNFADFAQGDMKIPRAVVMAGLAAALVIALFASWQFAWRERSSKAGSADTVLRADAGYWVSMFIAGTLGTVIGDYSSHNLGLGDGGAALLLVPILALLFVTARNGLLRSLPNYWLTIVMVRAAGTAVGDYEAGRHMLGLALGTLVTGTLFVALLALWREPKAGQLVTAER